MHKEFKIDAMFGNLDIFDSIHGPHLSEMSLGI